MNREGIPSSLKILCKCKKGLAEVEARVTLRSKNTMSMVEMRLNEAKGMYSLKERSRSFTELRFTCVLNREPEALRLRAWMNQ